MATFYHGSLFRYLTLGSVHHLRKAIKNSIKRVREFVNPPDPAIREHRRTYRQLIARRSWRELQAEIFVIARYAEEKRDSTLAREMAWACERMENHAECSRLKLLSKQIRLGNISKEWDGSNLAGKNLVVDFSAQARKALDLVFRYVRFVPLAARSATSCTLITEPRLVPLLKRSLPRIRFVSSDGNTEAEHAKAAVIASYENLAMHFATGAEAIAENFKPLLSDPLLTERFRRQYSSRPVIGISWGSRVHGKDAPTFSEWSDFINATPATFVSLQYGPVSAALRRLKQNTGGKLVHDPAVDQLKDMDLFAAQVAAMDAVVSVSNTVAHTAGALGIPVYVLADDNFEMFWPVQSTTTPWYPSARINMKNGRPWNAVLAEVTRALAKDGIAGGKN